MKKRTMILSIIGIIALLVIGNAVYAQLNNSDKDNTADTANTDNEGNESAANDSSQDEGAGLTDTGDSEPAAIAATITYTNDGFSPSDVTVKTGDTIKVVNNSSALLTLASDPHPTHTENAELNEGGISPGSSKTFVVKNTGSWGFHNHENERHQGTLNVQ